MRAGARPEGPCQPPAVMAAGAPPAARGRGGSWPPSGRPAVPWAASASQGRVHGVSGSRDMPSVPPWHPKALCAGAGPKRCAKPRPDRVRAGAQGSRVNIHQRPLSVDCCCRNPCVPAEQEVASPAAVTIRRRMGAGLARICPQTVARAMPADKPVPRPGHGHLRSVRRAAQAWRPARKLPFLPRTAPICAACPPATKY